MANLAFSTQRDPDREAVSPRKPLDDETDETPKSEPPTDGVMPLEVREECGQAFRDAIPNLRAMATGTHRSCSIPQMLAAASLLGRYAFSSARNILLPNKDVLEAALRAMKDVFDPDEREAENFFLALTEHLHEREVESRA